MAEITKEVAPVYFNFMTDWYYSQYLLIGGYGSGKSYQVGLKIILKLLEEKRRALVVREVYETITDSCYDLLCEILMDLDLYTDDVSTWRRSKRKALCLKSPLRIKFKNGSSIIFRGMDKIEKIKSINDVSIVWVEECTEVKYDGYKELLGRVRTPNVSLHFILTCNPVGFENWVYRHFFKRIDDNGKETVIIDEEELYKKKYLVYNDTYYMHTVPDDNIFLPKAYLKRLDEIIEYDPYLWNVARNGKFGAAGTRVLPQLIIAKNAKVFKNAIHLLGDANKYFGFDFGFEESYNAIISMAVDTKNSILYIYDEIYRNHLTDDQFLELEKVQELKETLINLNERGYQKLLVADSEDPKAISYYKQSGIPIRKCKNRFPGSRLSNTRKIKRFKHIVVSPKCKNTIRELKDLTYKKDSKGNLIYDEFNIDPHTFSAIWYGLDTVTVADLKERKNNSYSV